MQTFSDDELTITPSDIKEQSMKLEAPLPPLASDESTHQISDEPQDNQALQPVESIVDLKLSKFREILFIAVVCLAQFMAQAALGQAVTILHVIGDHYNIKNPGVLAWFVAGYSLTVSTFILLSGRLGDVFGYKLLFVIGFIWFAVWSLVAGLAVYSNYVLFIFARVFQGIGPSICLPNGLALLGASFPPGMKKNLSFAAFGASAPVGSIVGSAFAGIFALTWWPYTFFSFAIALLVIAVASVYAIPTLPRRIRPATTARGLLAQLDVIGGLIGVTALVLFNFAWNQAGIVGWNRAEIITCLVLGVASAMLFFYFELRVATNPLIPFQIFTSDVSFVCACIACGWGAFGIWYYYAWQFMEVIKGGTPLLAAAWVAPVAISGACASVGTGLLLSVLRPAWIMTIALTVFLIGSVILATTPPDQVYWAQLFVISVVMPWGMDMSFPAGTIILSNAVKKEDQGVAASLINTIVNYSISLALGFAGTIEVHTNEGGHNKAQVLKGIRSAEYMAIGLSGFGVILSLVFVAKTYKSKNGQPGA